MTNLTPKEIVQELDKYIIGQDEAKRAVANALRNRWRRKFVNELMRDEIIPHNILMIGQTGVGKTEIARRLAKLSKSPFIKVEATKFTEVGYVGRDVESIIRDLIEMTVSNIRKDMKKGVEENAKEAVSAKIINVLVGEKAQEDTKTSFKIKLNKGELDDKEIEMEFIVKNFTSDMNSFDIPGGQVGIMNMGDMISKALGQQKTKLIKTTVKNAFKNLLEEECDKLIDEEKAIKDAIYSVEQDGIVFLDEIDKIANKGRDGGGRGEVSREGVQRDLLPLIEGTIVNTKYGPIKTTHILFIASGAFHIAKPSDLLPELQGRLPVRVQLNPLTEEDIIKILNEPEYNLPKQYKALLGVDNVELDFTKTGIKKIAEIVIKMNLEIENIGARRLHTILEKLLEDISYSATDKSKTKLVIDAKYVESRLDKFININVDNNKFIL